ncbi:hypothetical protein HYR69_02315 [Candidatus Sumerlaeota bacterium]|nr:hypothetical protein [Candidatus Sumerlaeota bacterium]MBI3735701.1 hypothetical protein [Candidatus Sumerlaeota bacterium]
MKVTATNGHQGLAGVTRRVQNLLDERLDANKVKINCKVEFYKKDDGWWYFLVRPEKEPKEAFPYFHALSETELRMRGKTIKPKGLHVALIPIDPND